MKHKNTSAIKDKKEKTDRVSYLVGELKTMRGLDERWLDKRQPDNQTKDKQTKDGETTNSRQMLYFGKQGNMVNQKI